MDFLYFLETIRNPILDKIMLAVTFLGEEIPFMVAAMFVLWCVDKYKGYYLLFVGFLGTQINQLLKVTFKIERPWVKDPSFKAVEGAIPEATGYSFPSGHTQSSVGVFGTLFVSFKNVAFKVLCLALCLLVPFSRMYLGVHTPLDVGVSFAIAILLIAFFGVIFKIINKKPKGMRILIASMVLISVLQVIYMTVTLYSATEPELVSSIKNAYKMLGAVLGMVVVYELDVRYVNFNTKAVWWAQIIKLIGGLALTVAVKELCYFVFGFIPFEPLSRAFSYFVMVVFAGSVWPSTFKFFSRFEK
ncbi:MAG: phosphatase PAP2 family protein [Clostridia bacterium]|nr:phosphatase PAP2 family protein [Clostridia bacterium]